ncbi:MAG: hypothetical protein ACO1N3_04610 [Gammaproteobacteria bacterium]
MKNIFIFSILISQLAFATETLYPGTPSDMDRAYILDKRPVYWPAIKKDTHGNHEQRNSQLPPQIMPQPTGE